MNKIIQAETGRASDFSGLMAISTSLCISMFAGFVVGSNDFLDRSSIFESCNRDLSLDQCISLRATIATEEATSISKWLLWIAAGSFVASTSALMALFFTYRQGQFALKFAREANQISDRNAQAQARAYLVLQSVGGKVFIEFHNRVRLSICLNFHNSGLSPALRVKTLSIASLHVADGNGASVEVVAGEEFDLSDSHWQQDIGAGQSWEPIATSWILANGVEIHDLICKGGAYNAVTVKTSFQYEDVFGMLHKETACFQGIINHGGPDDPYTVLERGPDDIFDRHASRRVQESGSNTAV
ncbi:hypothetical protein MACH17_15670 [Phaeobacter inhibens]|uniref:hypothetical protein n=1 Tax=Phaeobacter inhibens TaxID=221822 RepID=UPI002746C514|nr:hypothetical protein [Phaeobacter inhibens]GLO70050.1 hypothetical protein MACH17_15670 [Phaeobacter inhibens]